MRMNHVIIVAGGSGLRMNSEIPKQFLLLSGKPVLMHSIERFKAFDPSINIIVVLPQKETKEWQSLCDKYNFGIRHMVATGGNTRFHSVKNGLETIKEDGLIGVHDGVRPVVSNELIKRCYAAAKEKGNAVPFIPVRESIRKVEGNKNEAVTRDSFVIIQTPQCFTSDVLRKAFLAEYQTSFTDDASVIEAAGQKINLVEGEFSNIKITFPGDLLYAEMLLSNEQKKSR
jgi:2-C-methyl-D-erythritol 4-phosphate cytidylyltransferase